MLFQDDGDNIPNRSLGSIHSFSHFCMEKLQHKECSMEIFGRLAPRLIVLFKKEAGSVLDSSNNSNLYLNEEGQKIILTLISVSIRANNQRETIYGLATSVFRSILPNKVSWEGLFENSFGIKFLTSYLELTTVMPPGSSPTPKEVASELLSLLEKLLSMDSNSQAISGSLLLPFSTLRGIFAAIAASYPTDYSAAVWNDCHSRVLSCVEKASRLCSPFNISDTSRLLVRTLNAGMTVVKYLKAQDAKNMTPILSFASSSAAPNSVSKWKSPAAQLGYIESSSASSRLFDCATAVFACKEKVDEPILNELCVSVFSVCSQSSKTLVAPTFQLALTEILQQMRKVNVLKEMAHMSFAAAEGFSDLTASTSRNEENDEDATTAALTLTHESLFPSEGELAQLCTSLNSVTHIIISLMELLEFYQQDRLGFGEHQPYFNSLLVISSRASLHLLLSRHALLRPGGGEFLTDELRSVADSSVRSSSESNFNQKNNKRTTSANMTETSNSLFYSTDIKISETSEVNSFLDLIFMLFAREVAYVGYGDSSLQKFLHACLEICHQNCKDESHFNLSPQNEEYNGDGNPEGLPTESETMFNEVSTISLVHALGQAALAVHSVHFIRIAVEGLSGLLSYRLGYHIVSAIIRQLVQLVTLAPNTVISADEETSNISYVGLRNLVLDTVITGFEREYTTMMHIIANDTSSNGSSESTKSIFIGAEYLAAASDALLFLCERVFKLGECATLTAIKHRLSDLFIRLSILVYSQENRGQPVDIDLVEGLALLLHPLSILFELESLLRHHKQNHKGKRKGSVSDLERDGDQKQQFRSLWFVLVLFRVKETARWGHYSNWLTCLQRIAATSPALVFHPSPNLTLNGITIADGLLTLDLTSDPVLNTLLYNCRKTTKGVSSIFSKSELNIIKKFAKFNGAKLTLPELYFAVTVQFCESLRSGGSLDFRPMLVYLEKSECKSLQNVLIEIAQHVFSVWLEAANARLSDAEIAEINIAIVALPNIERENSIMEQEARLPPLSHHSAKQEHKDGLVSLKMAYGLCDFTAVSSDRVRSIIREVFLHILSRVAHVSDNLRQFSLFAARHIIDRLLWLKRSCEGVFFLLDCLHEMEILFALASGKPFDLNNSLQATHYAYIHQQIVSRSHAFLPSSYVCATELWFGDLHRAVSDLGCVLCLAELPNTQDKILEVACDIMEFAYFWFCNASGELYAVDTASLLQEYLLLNHIHVIQNIHIGASIANELKCLTVPQYHIVPFTYAAFCNQRIAAATKMSQLRSDHHKVSAQIKLQSKEKKEDLPSAENSVSKAASDRLGARQAEYFNLKSHFISEIAAIVHPSVNDGDVNSLVLFAEDVCRALGEMGSGHAVAAGGEGLTVEVLWRAAALLYVWNSSATQAYASHHIHSHRHHVSDVTIHNDALSQWDRAIADRQSAFLMEALSSSFRRNICRLHKQHLTECIIDIWKWLIASSPRITCPLIASAIQTLQDAIKHAPSSRFLADTLTLLMDFFDEILLSHNSEVAILLFSFLEFYVHHVSEGEHVVVYVCIFKVLSLGVRLINLSFTQYVRISINRRRMFRESIIFCALKYFQVKTLSPDNTHIFSEYASSKSKGKKLVANTDSEVLLLSNFLKDVHSDSKFWTLDYKIDTAAVAAAAKAKKTGKAIDRSLSVAYGGSGNNEELAQNVPEKFGLSAATVHFYNDIYKSSSSPYRISHRNKQLLQSQLIQDSKLQNVSASIQTVRHGGKVKALMNQRALGISGFEYKSSTTNTVGGSKQKSDPLLFLKAIAVDGNGSGLLLLLDLLALHEILHNTPTISPAAKADPALIHSLSNAFKALSKSDDAYNTAVRVAYAISPSLALTVFKRFEIIRQARSRSNLTTQPALDPFEKLLIHRPNVITENVHNYWQFSAVFVNIVSLENVAVSHGPRKQDEHLKALVFLPSVPVHVAIALLSRCDADRKEIRRPALEANKIPAVVRFLVRSLFDEASADLNSIISYLPQLLQLLRRDEFQCLHFLISKLGQHSALLCHRLVWMLQTEASPVLEDQLTGGRKGKEPKYGLCNKLSGSDPLPTSAKALLESVCVSLPHAAKLFTDAQVDYFNRATNISAILKGEKDKDKHAEIICSNFADSIKLSQGLYMPTRPGRLVVGVNYESAAPMQSAAKCPFLLEFQTVEWGGPDDMLKAKIQNIEYLVAEGGQPRQGSPPGVKILNDQEESKVDAEKKADWTAASATTPKRVVLELDSDEEDDDKSESSYSSSSSSSDSEQDELRVQNGKVSKKQRKAKKPSNAMRRKGMTSGLNGIGKKDQLAIFSPKTPQYSRLPTANPNQTSLPAFSLSSSVSSSPPALIAIKDLSKQSIAGKLGFKSRASDYAYNSTKGNGTAGAAEDADNEEGDGDQNDSVGEGEDDEFEEDEDPLAFQQQRAAAESQAGKSHAGQDHNKLLTVISTGLKDKDSGLLEGDKRGMDVWHARKKKVRATHSGPKIYRDACIFKVFDDCRQDVITMQVISLLDAHFAKAGLPVYLRPYTVIPNRSGLGNNIGAILEVIPNVKSRDQIGKYGSKTLLQYYQNQFGDRGSYEFRRAQWVFAKSLAGYAVVCYLLRIKDRHNGNILIDKDGHLIHIDYGFILGISPGGNLGFETAAFKFSQEMVELLDGRNSEVFETFVSLCCAAFLSVRGSASTMDGILSIVSAFADSDLPCFKYKEDVLVRLKSRFMPGLATNEAADAFKKLVLSASNDWTTSAYDGIQKLQNNIYSEKWK